MEVAPGITQQIILYTRTGYWRCCFRVHMARDEKAWEVGDRPQLSFKKSKHTGAPAVTVVNCWVPESNTGVPQKGSPWPPLTRGESYNSPGTSLSNWDTFTCLSLTDTGEVNQIIIPISRKGSHVFSITSVLGDPPSPLSLPRSSKGTLANKNAVSIKPSIHPKIPHREQCSHCWVSNQRVKRLTDRTAAGHFGSDFFIHGLKHSFSKVLLSNIIKNLT